MILKQVRYILLLLGLLTSSSVFSQMRIRFVDESNEILMGVKAVVSDIEHGVIVKKVSDDRGVILLSKGEIQGQKQLLVQSQLFGYKTREVMFSIDSEIEFVMEPDYLTHDEVVITAQYKKQEADESVHRVRVIGRQKMDAMAAVTLRDVLTNELGVRLAQDNVLGNAMTLQGISGENVKILIDGVPVVGRLNGSVDLSQINLENIERIEIVEGPLSVNYGTNALAGVVNLISKDPRRNQLRGGASAYYESIGHYNVNASVTYGTRYNSMGITVGRNFFDGWRDDHGVFTNPNPVADSARFMTWKPKEQLFGNFFYKWNKKGWIVHYKLDGFHEFVLNRGYPRPPYQETAFDDEYRTRRIDNALRVNKKILGKGNVKALFSYNRYDRHKNTYFVDLTTLDRGLTTTVSDHDTSVFDQWVFRGSYASTRDSAPLNFQVGYDILLERAAGRRILDGRQQQSDYALFATLEYRPIKRLAFLPGVRYAYNTTYNPPILPSLNAKWDIAKKWRFRTSYARGFRAPGIKELYFEFIDINHNIVGNENLKAESSHNFLASLNYKTGSDKIRWESEVNGFYNNITDRISLAATGATQFSYVNIGSFQSAGSRWLGKMKHKSITANVGFGWIGRASNVLSDELKDDFLFYPEVQSSIICTVQKSKTSFALFYKYQGKLLNFRLNESNEVYQAVTSDYNLLDFTVTQGIWKNRVKLSIGVKNLLNVTQVASGAGGGVHSDNVGAVSVGTGRSYFASLRVALKKSLKSRVK